MKYILLTGLLLFTACGGSSTEPTTITETIIEEVLVEAECPVPVPCEICNVCDAPVTCEVCPELTVCPVVEPVVEPEPVTYYKILVGTLDEVATQINTYDENGTILSRVDESRDSITTYEYDSNDNLVELVRKVSGEITFYLYYTYDDNSNLLESSNSSGKHEINTYTDNKLTQSRIDVTGDGEYNIVNYTWSGDNLLTEDHVTYETIYENMYDTNGNIILKETYIKEVLTKTETWTWEAFTL